MDYEIKFNVDECCSAKEELRRDNVAMTVWNENFSPASAIGKCTYLFSLHEPNTAEEFYKKYVSYANQHHDLKISDRGLSEKEIVDLAERYKAMAEADRDVERPLYVYVNDALCHIIVETFVGGNIERELIRMISESGIKAEPAGDTYDRTYGIDIMCERADGRKFGVQVKPYTFLTSTRPDPAKDRERLHEKRLRAMIGLGLDTYYAVYVKEGLKVEWYRNKNGGLSHRFEDLMVVRKSPDGKTTTVDTLPEVVSALRNIKASMKNNG